MDKDGLLLDEERASLDWLLPDHATMMALPNGARKGRLYLVASVPDGTFRYAQIHRAAASTLKQEPHGNGIELVLEHTYLYQPGEFPTLGEGQKDFLKGCCTASMEMPVSGGMSKPMYGEAAYLGEMEENKLKLRFAKTAFAYHNHTNYIMLSMVSKSLADRETRIPILGMSRPLELEVAQPTWLMDNHTLTRRHTPGVDSEHLLVYGTKGDRLTGAYARLVSSKLQAKAHDDTDRRLITNTVTIRAIPFELKGSADSQLVQARRLAIKAEADSIHVGNVPSDPTVPVTLAVDTLIAHCAISEYKKLFEPVVDKVEEQEENPKSSILFTP